jgi:membrane-associated protein
MNSLVSVLPEFLRYGYFALFALMLVGGLYVPVPSNIALIGAGALSHFSQDGLHFNIFIAGLIGLAGSVIGDVASYYIARKLSSPKRRAAFEKKHKSLHKLEKYLKQHPLLTVSITRLIGFLSPAVNTLSGFTKLRANIFILGDVIGNIVYVIVFMGAGYLVGSANGHLITLLGVATATLVVLAILYIGGILLMRKD